MRTVAPRAFVSVRNKEGFTEGHTCRMILAVKEEKGARKKKVYAAKTFARGAMVCPCCQYVLEESVAECPKCGFSGQVAVQKFPFPAPPLSAVIDPSNQLTKEEAAAISKKVEKFRSRLPQVRFLNCIVPLEDDVNLREFGFWILNAGEMKEGNDAKSFAVFLLINPKKRTVSVTVGYGLEPFVEDKDWVRICEGCRDLFYRQKYREGIERFLNESIEYLSEQALAVQKEAKK